MQVLKPRRAAATESMRPSCPPPRRSDAAQAHNDNLVARQDALGAAWEELKAEAPADWDAAWAEKRKAALAAGGFAVVF